MTPAPLTNVQSIKEDFESRDFISDAMAIRYINEGLPTNYVIEKFLRSLGYNSLANTLIVGRPNGK